MKKLLSSVLLLLVVTSLSAQITREQALQRLEQDEKQKVVSEGSATLKSSSRLFKEKDDLTTVITIIPAGTTVKVTGSDSTYYKVVFEESEGYILKRHAVLSEQPVQAQELQPENKIPEVSEEEPAVQQESRFSYLERKYGTTMAARLSAGKIWKGMTAQMVRDSWGNPGRINKSSDGNLMKEEWIYRNTWLYMQNGILTEWGPIKK